MIDVIFIFTEILFMKLKNFLIINYFSQEFSFKTFNIVKFFLKYYHNIWYLITAKCAQNKNTPRSSFLSISTVFRYFHYVGKDVNNEVSITFSK